ncbi:heme-binding protein [Chryseobacterium culicis]|nr:heme-binding protein [Chryseobacterium culicis]
MSYKIADKVLHAAKEKALSLNIPVTIAVVDAGGHLVT